MTNRLKVILVVGVVAIAMAYLLTKTTTDGPVAEDSSYEQQLAKLREKQKEIASKKQDSGYSALNATTENALARHTNAIAENVNSTLQSFQKLMPSAAEKPVNEVVEPQERMSYLKTMPVNVIEATRKPEAAIVARQEAGRADPFARLGPAKAFPRSRSSETSGTAAGKRPAATLGHGPEGLPPPPPGLSMPPPPPPEMTAEMPPPAGISVDELPPPPEKPLLMRKLKLNGIVGDRVILAFKDRNYQEQNGYRRFITLAEGQVFDNVRVVDVTADRAVLEEDGEQTTVRLAPIR